MASPYRCHVLLVEQLERKLDLSRSSSRVIDHAEARACHDVRGQSKVDDIENVEKLRAKLKFDRLPAQWSLFQ